MEKFTVTSFLYVESFSLWENQFWFQHNQRIRPLSQSTWNCLLRWFVLHLFVLYRVSLRTILANSRMVILLLPGAELPSRKFWPSQRPLSTSLDPGRRLSSFFIFIWQMSCLILSSHLYLGLPCDLLVRGFQLNIFLTVLVSGILCIWPNQLSLWALMWLIILLCFISLSNSSLVLRCQRLPKLIGKPSNSHITF